VDVVKPMDHILLLVHIVRLSIKILQYLVLYYQLNRKPKEVDHLVTLKKYQNLTKGKKNITKVLISYSTDCLTCNKNIRVKF